MNTYAIIKDDDSTVVNIVEWNGDESKWKPEAGFSVKLVSSDEFVQIGGVFDGDKFLPPIDKRTLEEAKKNAFRAIDEKTVSLIRQGFKHGGKTFSLSDHAQNYWNGLGNLISNNLLTGGDFPLHINTIDDSDTYDIQDISDALMIYATAAATVKSHLASGTKLKDEIRAASTLEEVDAVVDTR